MVLEVCGGKVHRTMRCLINRPRPPLSSSSLISAGDPATGQMTTTDKEAAARGAAAGDARMVVFPDVAASVMPVDNVFLVTVATFTT